METAKKVKFQNVQKNKGMAAVDHPYLSILLP